MSSSDDSVHARPVPASAEPLYDPDIPTPSHAERARTLAARLTTGTLATLSTDPEGYPHGSFVTMAFDAGDPVFLVSTMAEHTRNLQRDERASLLVAEREQEDPLANGRVTLLGPCSRVAEDRGAEREAFLATHPNAAYYVDFGDFAFWKLRVMSVRYIGGYGRMSWVEAADWHAAEPDPLASAAAGIIAHMNDDHADTLPLYCNTYSRASGIAEASMTGVDRYGFEMSAITPDGPRPVRVGFPVQVSTPREVRTALVEMLKAARG